MPIIELRSTARDDARRRAFQLAYEAQDGGTPHAPAAIEAIAREAHRSGWDDIRRACLFSRAIVARVDGDDAEASADVAALIDSSVAADDQVMLAIGLGLRSTEAFSGSDPNSAMSRDADLARGVVLLERAEGHPIERMAAHKVCGVAFSTRSLFELGDEQYRAALAAGREEPPGTLDTVLAQIACNMVETQVCWAAMLRQLGDRCGVGERWRSWSARAEAMAGFEMSPGVRAELTALGLVLEAVAGHDTVAPARELLEAAGRPPNRRTAALLQLAIALGHAGAGDGGAAQSAQSAAALLDTSLQNHLYDLALLVDAEVEAGGGESAGLRYGRRQVEQRWVRRLSSLAAMQSLIQSERVAEQIERLNRHAHLDDLTGIGNRRALGEYLTEIKRDEVTSIGLVLLDVDDFKSVNDLHGHLAGDAVLVEIARTLHAGLRAGDLAARLGGDEFVVILAGAGLDDTRRRAADLVGALAESGFDELSTGLRVTLSAGVSAGPPACVPDLWAGADAALYRAKAGGGGRVQAVGAAPPEQRAGTAPVDAGCYAASGPAGSAGALLPSWQAAPGA